MARIPMTEYPNAGPEAKKRYDAQVARNGRMTNMKKTLLHSIPAFDALMTWYPLRDAARDFLTEREINIFCHAISAQNNCLICSSFFRKILIDAGEDPDHLRLNPREQTLVDYGLQCQTGAQNVTDALFDTLREYWDDQQIVLLTAFAGLMIATNLINTALRVELDDYLESYTKR